MNTKPTQADKILKVLQEANGGWVNGRYFNNTMLISQFHTRIHELQKRGHIIEASEFKDEFGFKSYRYLGRREVVVEVPKKLEPGECCMSFRVFKVHGSECALSNPQPVMAKVQENSLFNIPS